MMMVTITILIALAALVAALVQLFHDPTIDTRIILILTAGIAGPVVRATETGETGWFWLYAPLHPWQSGSAHGSAIGDEGVNRDPFWTHRDCGTPARQAGRARHPDVS